MSKGHASKLLVYMGLSLSLNFGLSDFAEAETILFVRKGSPQFTEVTERMTRDLSKKYSVIDWAVSKETPYEEFQKKIQATKPDLAIYMDNLAVSFGLKYNKESPKKLMAVAMMGLNLKNYLKGNSEIAGIAFEPPAYTLMTHFRFIVDKKIKNAVVFYRKRVFQDTIDSTTGHLASEGIKLHAIDVEQNGVDPKEIADFIKKNLKKTVTDGKKYDVVWVILDSAILTPDLFQTVWMPAAKSSKIPFVTGVQELVSKEMDFAAFAITPNFSDLASQAVQIVDQIFEEKISPANIGVEELIGVDRILNQDRLKKLGLKVKAKDLSEIKVIE